MEIRHDLRERNVEQRVVKVAEKRADKEREHDELGREIGGVAVVLRVGGGFGCGRDVRHGIEWIAKKGRMIGDNDGWGKAT